MSKKDISDYDINKAYWCGDGVPTTLSPCQLSELASNEKILIGNTVRMALNEHSELKEAVLRDIPFVRDVCRSHGHEGCVEKLDGILRIAGGKEE